MHSEIVVELLWGLRCVHLEKKCDVIGFSRLANYGMQVLGTPNLV